MNVNRREHRETGVQRGAGQRTPRSGGRIAAQRTTRGGIGPMPVGDARARGAQEFPVRGSAALSPRKQGDDERELRVWDSSAEPGQGRRMARPARTAERPPQLKVAPPLPVVRPRAPFVALILVLVVGGVLGILLVQTKVNENAFRLDKLQDEQATLDVREQQLKQEIAKHEDPGNLAAQARKLGLVESGPLAFIRLPDGKVIGVPQPAQGEPAITSRQGG